MNQTTRDRLIDAARRIFAEKGYDAASVREITASASANLGAITYHFGTKEGLYDAVLESLLGPVSRELGLGREPEEAAGGALERIDRMIARLFEHLGQNPDLQLLVLQHVVTRRALPGPMSRTLGMMLERLSAEVRAGQREGVIRGGDPVLMAISVLSQPIYFGLVGRLAPERLKGAGARAPMLAAISAHGRGFIRAGLTGGTEAENG